MKKMYGQLYWSHSTPPRIGPAIGAINVVMAHKPTAAGAFSLGKMRSNRVCDKGISGPPARPCSTRKASSMPSELARPHSAENAPNRIIDMMNTRTVPNRLASQPVSGTVIASATAYEVMTEVPWLDEAPSAPEIVDTETLAIVVSSTAMKLAAASSRPAPTSCAPSSGFMAASEKLDDMIAA